MKYFSITVLIMSITACTSTPIDNNTKVLSVIYPIHTEHSDVKYWEYNKEYAHSYIDVDGNQYITKWKLNDTTEFDKDRFSAARATCSALTSAVFPRDLLNSPEISKADLLYKQVALCFSRLGYELAESWAHSPQMIAIQLTKPYSSYGETVGAGGRVFILPDGLEMNDLLPSAEKCYKTVAGRYNQGDAAGYLFVDMNPVIEGFATCLREAGITVVRE